jgi:hypothetical protein
VVSYEAPGAVSQKTSVFTPTGCDALGFAPTATGAVGAVGATKRGSFPPLSTTLSFDPEEAALKSAEVTLPPSLASNVAVLQRACQRVQADANACPESSRVGTAVIDSPLQAQPVSGPVYLAFNSNAALPGLIVWLPPPVGLRIDGFISLASTGLRNTFPSNPDLPLRSFKLEFDGGPQGALTLARDLCDPDTPVAIDVSLVAHSGKTRAFKQELATPGCDPLAKVSLTKRGRSFTLAAVLKSPRGGPALKRAKVALPKALKRGRLRARVRIDGKKARAPRRAKRAIAPKLGKSGARRVKIVWRGLKRIKGKRLRQTVVVPVTMRDSRGKTTRLRVRVKRG